MQALQRVRAKKECVRAFRATCFYAGGALFCEVVIACVERDSGFLDERPPETFQPRGRSVADDCLLPCDFGVDWLSISCGRSGRHNRQRGI